MAFDNSDHITYQFFSRHWDEEDIHLRCQELAETLTAGGDVSAFIADGIPQDDRDELKAYFGSVAGMKTSYVYSGFHVLSRVGGADEYNDLRGVLELCFRVEDEENEKVTEHTVILHSARMGDSSGMKWKFCRILWNDGGVDVSPVEIHQLDAPSHGEEVCVVTTDAGEIRMRLFPEKAPLAVANWKALAAEGFYDGTPFSRVIRGFVIQGGALDGSGDEDISSFGGYFRDEVEKGLYCFNGAVALGNTGPHTNGNQFFIVECPEADESVFPKASLPVNVEETYREAGGLPELDGRYTVFGQVFQGMDVVERIASQPVDGDDYPLGDPVKIRGIEFEIF